MRLAKIQLERFCGFESFAISFEQCTVLIGPNNGGKTTILKAITFTWKALKIAWQASKPQIATDWRNWQNALLEHNKQLEQINASGVDAMTKVRQRKSATDNLQNRNREFSKSRNSFVSKLSVAAQSLALPETAALFFDHDTSGNFNIALDIVFDSDEYQIAIQGKKGDQLTVQVSPIGKTKSFSISSPEDLLQWESFLDRLTQQEIEFLPPVITLLPEETAISWPEIEKRIEAGKEFEVWRNRIHWLCEGRDPDLLKRVIARVRLSIPDVAFQSPSRTRDSKSKVRITYQEGGKEFDISESGSGLRTLFAISAQIELSKSSIILLDEPDSHLHSTVQRQVAEFLAFSSGNSKQVIISTHAPDMIEEFPLDCLYWIDRKSSRPQKADDLSNALVNLGAITHSQALKLIDAKAVLYFEDKPDERVFSGLIEACGKAEILSLCTLARLNGAGDSIHLPIVARFLKSHHNRTIPMIALLDGDYSGDEVEIPDVDGIVFIAKLPCKELENLLLLQPEAIYSRLEEIAKTKENGTVGSDRNISTEEISSMVDLCSKDPVVTDQVRLNWITKRLPSDRRPDSGELQVLEEKFRALWDDPLFRRRHCPGKKVLRALKKQLQEKCGLSFSDASAFSHYKTPLEIHDLFEKIHTHLKLSLSSVTDKQSEA